MIPFSTIFKRGALTDNETLLPAASCRQFAFAPVDLWHNSDLTTRPSMQHGTWDDCRRMPGVHACKVCRGHLKLLRFVKIFSRATKSPRGHMQVLILMSLPAAIFIATFAY